MIGLGLVIMMICGSALSVAGAAIADTLDAQVLLAYLTGGGGVTRSANYGLTGAFTQWPMADAPGNSISGRILDVNLNPVTGVVVSDGSGHSAITDAGGHYTVPRLNNSRYVFVPSKAGYVFSPISRTVTALANLGGQDFSAATLDAFETDNTCAQARPISSDGSLQLHSFHQPGDEDWVVLAGLNGARYVIEGQAPPNSPADLTLELYGQCNGAAQSGQSNTFSPGIRFIFTTTANAPIYLKLSNSDAGVGGPNLVYELSVRALAATAALNDAVLIVAGRNKLNDLLQPNIQASVQTFYEQLVAHGFDKAHIRYLSHENLPGVTAGMPTTQTIRDAIVSWAPSVLQADGMLTVYMMDHGDSDVFYLDKPSGQFITPQQLNEWLSALETTLPSVKINVFIEACYSGTFVDQPAPQMISKPGRVIIASTGAASLAHASTRGAVFSDQFLSSLWQGISFYSGFQIARWATLAAYPDQVPWLDDDGDGIPNEPEDGRVAQQRGFNFSGSDDQFAPFIAVAKLEHIQGQDWVRAVVTDNVGIKYAWATIYPPSYIAPSTQEELVIDAVHPVTLTAGSLMNYEVGLMPFGEVGVYRIVITAEDINGLRARPVVLSVPNGQHLFLPVIQK